MTVKEELSSKFNLAYLHCAIACGGQCCQNCAAATGHFRGDLLMSPKVLQLKKEYGFDDKTGWLGENGCKLPVNERSAACLGWYCLKLDPLIDKKVISDLSRKVYNQEAQQVNESSERD